PTPGLTAWLLCCPDVALCATRALHFFRTKGRMPETLELALTLPSELGPADAVLAELRERVRIVEVKRAAQRRRTGARVGSTSRACASWHDRPPSVELRRNLRPGVPSKTKWRIEVLLRN